MNDSFLPAIQNILVADDSGTARMIIRRCLEIAGLGGRNYYEASNGVEAMEILKGRRIDLLVTDLNMPVLDGRALLASIKSDQDLSGTPVIVVTSGKNPAKEKDLLHLGARLVLGKPLSPAEAVRACACLGGRAGEVAP